MRDFDLLQCNLPYTYRPSTESSSVSAVAPKAKPPQMGVLVHRGRFDSAEVADSNREHLYLRLCNVEPGSKIFYLDPRQTGLDAADPRAWQANGRELPIETNSKIVKVLFGSRESREIAPTRTSFWIAQRNSEGNFSEPTLVRAGGFMRIVKVDASVQQIGVNLRPTNYSATVIQDSFQPIANRGLMSLTFDPASGMGTLIAPRGSVEPNLRIEVRNETTGAVRVGMADDYGAGKISVALKPSDVVTLKFAPNV